MDTEHLKKVMADLPVIQQIARRPHQQNPLLSLILAQARALAEIERWAADAQQQATSDQTGEKGADDA